MKKRAGSKFGRGSGFKLGKMLLSPLELKKMDALALYARRAFSGTSRGEKRSVKRGSSVEFADFRAYNAGDDIRRIDWNAYARFDRLFLKMFLEEEDLDVTLLLDASASMGFGEPSKIASGARVLGALGYIGLVNFERVSAATFGDSSESQGLRTLFPPSRGKAMAGQMMRFFHAQQASGSADFARAAQRLALQSKRSGLAFVASDFLLTQGYEVGLKTLAARGFETTVIQILARDELEPQLRGDLKLVDAETGATREISVTASLFQRYKANLHSYTANLRAFCLRYGMNYILVASDTPVEDVVSKLLRVGSVK